MRSKTTHALSFALGFMFFSVLPAARAGTFTANYLGGGVWEQDGNWSTTAYPNNGHFVVINGNAVPDNNPFYNVVLNIATPCALGIGVRVDAVTVANGATLNIANNASVTSNGALVINGPVTLNSTDGGSQMRAGPGSGLSSTGIVSMSDSGQNYISGTNDGYTFTILAGGIVRGAGQMNLGFFGGNEHLLNFINHGLIEATRPTFPLQIGLGKDVGSNLTNDGTLRASGSGKLRVHSFGGNGEFNNAGGTISAIDNGVFRLAAPVILTGGTLTTSGNGRIGGDGNGGGSGIYKDVTNNGTMVIADNETIRLAGTITNNSLIRMDSTPGTAANLYFNNGTVLSGNGSLTMSDSLNNYIYGTNTGDSFTLGAGGKIQGAGTINPGFSGTGIFKFTNNGLLDANQPVGINFRIYSDGGASLTNNGTMRASNGSTLRFYNASAADLIINTGGRIEALDSSKVRLANAVTMEGGILATSGSGEIHGDVAGGGSGTFSNVTNTGTMVVASGEQMRISNSFVNNGVLRMDDVPGTGTNLYFSNTNITGTGVITLTNSANNYIYAANSGDTLTIGPTMTLRGGAQISPGFQGTGILNVVNQGLIESTSYLRIALYNDASTTANMLNTGTFRAAAGATIEMHAFSQGCKLTNDGGKIEVLDGSKFNVHPSMQLIQSSGTIDLSGGTITAPFGLDLNGGQLIGSGTFAGPVRNNGGIVSPGHSPGKITINGDYTQGANGALNMEIGGSTAGTSYDQLVVSGKATLGGTLNITAINGFQPTVGDVYTLVSASSFAGNFASVNISGFTAKVDYSSNGVTLTVTTTSGQLLNVATRMKVNPDPNQLIGGFIITGAEPKTVIIRAIGPTLSTFFTGVLEDPTLELFQGTTQLASNDNWKDSDRAAIEATGIPPKNDLESAIVRTLSPGAYTAIVRGKNGTSGIGLVEAYDLSKTSNSTLANIATRGFVDTGDNVMIGGFIIGGTGGADTRVVVRAIGPTLRAFGIDNALADPTLELRDGNGSLLKGNDNWKDTQQAEIEAAQLAPKNDFESAIIASLPHGSYTAIVRGNNNTVGVAVVEAYYVP